MIKKTNKTQFSTVTSHDNATKKLLKEVKKIFPKLSFVYDKDTNSIYSPDWIHHSTTKFCFRIHARLQDGQYLKMCFHFGEIRLDPLTLYRVNAFNQKCPSYYKAYITETTAYNTNYFNIEFNRGVKNVDEAVENFEGAMDYINTKSMVQLIKPIDYIINANRVSTKKMN